MLLQARARQPQFYLVTKQSTVTVVIYSPVDIDNFLPQLVHVLILCRPKTSQSGHINSSLSYVPKKSTVPEVSLLSCLLTAFLTVTKSKWLFAVTRNRKSSITEKLFKNSPRAVRVAVKLSACCELSTETNFQKSQRSHTSILNHNLSTATCPAAPGLQRLAIRRGGTPKYKN
jgi:hypothetical protein